MNRTTRVLLCLAVAVPMSVGAGTALAQSPSPDPILDQELTLTQMAGTAVAADAGITATFAAPADADPTLTGFGGCNQYSATWHSDGTTLSVGPITATLKACDPAVDALESQYLGLLQAAASWSLDGSALVIVSSDGSTLVYGGAAEESVVGSWEVESVGGVTPPAIGLIPTADFSEDGSLTGFGGCNSYNGTWTTDGASISIGALAATRKACEPADTFESSLFHALQGAQTWALDGGTLTIDGSSTIVLSDGSAPAGTLAGQDWLLVSIAGAPTDPSLGVDATFFDDGTLTGFAGCNQYHASYTVDGDTLTVGAIGSTRKLCAEDANAVESAYLAALQSATTFAVTDTGLVVTSADGSTLEFTVEGAPQPSTAPSTPEASTAPSFAPVSPVPSSPVPSGSSVPGSSGEPSGDIVGSWKMVEYAGQALPGGILDIGIVFDADGTFSGNGGCNDFSGSWSLSGTSLTLTDFVKGTGGTCDATTQQLEEGFFSLIPFVDTATFADGKLSLVSAIGGNTGFVFEPAS